MTDRQQRYIWARINPTLWDMFLDGVEAHRETFMRRMAIILQELEGT
jgi:hypothetical protein